MKHWARIIQAWPVDRVRPEHVSFQKLMQSRLQKANEALGTPAEQKEMRQINALYALLDDRFLKEYPLPAKVRHPQSSPTHYDDVVKEMDEAPTRTWVTSLVNRIKGSLRFS
jgi:hypothetical protein